MLFEHLSRSVFCFIASIFLLFAISPTTTALPEEQRDLYLQNILYYDISECNNLNNQTDASNGNNKSADECSCGLNKTNSGAGGDVDKFLKVLAHQESGGDPNQPGSAGGARGKYQYIDSTWLSSANTYYKPAARYAQAHLAPESAQDAVAFLEYSKKFKDFNSDLFKLAISHFYPAANSNPGLLDVIPPSNVITPRQYASKLINSIKNGGDWEKIPLKYADAPEFSKYANKISATTASTNDPTGTTLASDLCSTESDADNADVVGKISWPVDKKYWVEHPDWFTKPHHSYPASDIPVKPGTKVYSMTEGKVLSAGNNGSCGVGVFIQYQNGVVFGYCHGTPGSLKVKAGDSVRPGQNIMLSGFSGRVSPPGPGGAHLHLQIEVDGQNRCPQTLFAGLNKGEVANIKNLPATGCF